MSVATVDFIHPECEYSPHPCFADKLRYWRQHGMNLQVPQEWANNPTVREQEKQAIADARASGRSFELAHDKYRWV